MRILFIGNVLFSKYMLERLISNKENIVGVFTKKESNFNSDHIDLSSICINNSIPCFYVNNINDKENVNKIKELNPDVIYCFGFSQIIKKEILSIPPKGVVGFHPTHLPANRGRHPIIWALFLGLSKTASTFFLMDENADTGDIINQKEVPIYYEDDANTLYMRIVNTALIQIEEITNDLKQNNIKKIKQNNKYSNYWRKRNLEDGRIDFRMSSYAIYNLVRALTKPYVGAHILYKNKEIKIWKVREEALFLYNIEPGKVLEVNNEDKSILIKAYDNGIRILEHEFHEMPTEGEYIL